MGSTPTEQADEMGLLRTYLAERDCACPGCGYNLRKLEANRCPECAMQLQLEVRLTEPRLGALITGIVALAAGAGFGSLLVGFGVIMILTSNGRMGPAPFFRVTGIIAVVNGVALWIWLRYWKHVRKWPVGRRVGVALACWLFPVLSMLALVRWVR